MPIKSLQLFQLKDQSPYTTTDTMQKRFVCFHTKEKEYIFIHTYVSTTIYFERFGMVENGSVYMLLDMLPLINTIDLRVVANQYSQCKPFYTSPEHTLTCQQLNDLTGIVLFPFTAWQL